MKNNKLTKLPTGCKGLDVLLKGGIVENSIFFIEGVPGSGKTSLCLQFLNEGIKHNESVLFISLEETKSQIQKFFNHLWNENIDFLDASPSTTFFYDSKIYDVFTPADVERDPLSKKIYEEIIKIKPRRIAIDSITQFRFLANNPYQFLRYMLSLFAFLREHKITVVLTGEPYNETSDIDIRFYVDGYISLKINETTNRISVIKNRGEAFVKDEHEYEITDKGVEVYALPDVQTFISSYKSPVKKDGLFSSGVPSIDELLKGGLPYNSTTMITGSSGVGKTTLAMQFVKELSLIGNKILYFSFDEDVETLIKHCDSINLQISSLVKQGKLLIEEYLFNIIPVSKFFINCIEKMLENNISILVIDSINSFLNVFEVKNARKCLSKFIKYLTKLGITTFLIHEDSKIVSSDFQATSFNISNFIDNLIFLRYIEVESRVSKTIGILKKRKGDFEKTLREFEITEYGIKVGAPWTGLSGILTGNPFIIKKQQNE